MTLVIGVASVGFKEDSQVYHEPRRYRP